MMTRISFSFLYICFLSVIVSCAGTRGTSSSNDLFQIDRETILEYTKEVCSENNLRIYEEKENEDGSYEITVYRDERRKFTSRETAINRIRIVVMPIKGEEGFQVTIQQPNTHVMAQTASTRDYRRMILRSLNEKIAVAEADD